MEIFLPKICRMEFWLRESSRILLLQVQQNFYYACQPTFSKFVGFERFQVNMMAVLQAFRIHWPLNISLCSQIVLQCRTVIQQIKLLISHVGHELSFYYNCQYLYKIVQLQSSCGIPLGETGYCRSEKNFSTFCTSDFRNFS